MTIDSATRPAVIASALTLPNGARYYRCALQVNPFTYIARHGGSSTLPDETSYNAAVVETAVGEGIEVLAVTDHYRIDTARGLIEAATGAGLCVFPGFEAVTKDGVHFLCLFDPLTPLEVINRRIGECGIHAETDASPLGKFDALEFMEECAKWQAVCIAAHVAAAGGLLRQLSGQSRVRAWRSPYLLACSLPGPVSDAPDDLRPILQDKNPDYAREHRAAEDLAIAVVNAKDVSSAEDLTSPSSSSWIKMSEVSVEGLRQAFLDPGSRIRLASDPEPEDRTEIVAIAWKGGFLDGASIHFNDNLNVLIGGRGAGKSTVVESLRYALDLDPLGDEAQRAHDGIVRQVLRSGTKVSVLLRAHRPSVREYLIERTVPNPPSVQDEQGKVLDLAPRDISGRTEIYGQHEISELARDPAKRTLLLERFMDRDPGIERRKSELRRSLERSRKRTLEAEIELGRIQERLAALPRLEETLRRFQEAGLEEKLKDQSALVREEHVFTAVDERLEPIVAAIEELRADLPVDTAFLSDKALEGLPGADLLRPLRNALDELSTAVATLAGDVQGAVARARSEVADVRSRWDNRRRAVQSEYENILRELQKTRVDGAEFIQLRRQIEELGPLRDRIKTLEGNRTAYADERRILLKQWEDVQAEEFRRLEKAARTVSRRLSQRVRVQVTFGGDREALFELLRKDVGGRLSEAIETLRGRVALSLKDLADACRAGRDELVRRYGLAPGQAQRLADATGDAITRMEELELTPTTDIELNVSLDSDRESWRGLDDLSTGQKATAVLLLLLLESDAPLVVDQPEDDLDNRFIAEGVVPRMREEKRRRQFIFSTHNANIPVLGDAELIGGLSAAGEADAGHASIPHEHLGSIDLEPVRELVEELLEGGHEAFELRRRKYGF